MLNFNSNYNFHELNQKSWTHSSDECSSIDEMDNPKLDDVLVLKSSIQMKSSLISTIQSLLEDAYKQPKISDEETNPTPSSSSNTESMVNPYQMMSISELEATLSKLLDEQAELEQLMAAEAAQLSSPEYDVPTEATTQSKISTAAAAIQCESSKINGYTDLFGAKYHFSKAKKEKSRSNRFLIRAKINYSEGNTDKAKQDLLLATGCRLHALSNEKQGMVSLNSSIDDFNTSAEAHDKAVAGYKEVIQENETNYVVLSSQTDNNDPVDLAAVLKQIQDTILLIEAILTEVETGSTTPISTESLSQLNNSPMVSLSNQVDEETLQVENHQPNNNETYKSFSKFLQRSTRLAQKDFEESYLRFKNSPSPEQFVQLEDKAAIFQNELEKEIDAEICFLQQKGF